MCFARHQRSSVLAYVPTSIALQIRMLIRVAETRRARGARVVDLMIAATACAEGLPLYTRNPDDVRMLDGVVEIIAV